MGVIYLLHFSEAYRHARHYTGFAASEEGLQERLERHRRGDGARLMEVVAQAGITFEVAATWEGGRTLERKLKRRGGASRHCPLCKQANTEEKT